MPNSLLYVTMLRVGECKGCRGVCLGVLATDRDQQASIHLGRRDLGSATEIWAPGWLAKLTLESRTRIDLLCDGACYISIYELNIKVSFYPFVFSFSNWTYILVTFDSALESELSSSDLWSYDIDVILYFHKGSQEEARS